LPTIHGMKRKFAATGLLFVAWALSIILFSELQPHARAQVQTKTNSQLSPIDKEAIARFEGRVKNYVKLRNQVKGKLPSLSKDSTPEQIESFKKNFEAALRSARTGAKPGDIFNHEGADYIRRTIKTEFKGRDRVELREIVFEAETAGIPMRVNYPYPETKELTEMPATLLLQLPQLPKEVKYRFVGRNMLLVDRDNNLIIDYMLNALP
jgi:ABC-type transporter MlaC component